MPSQPKSETPPWVALIVTLVMLLLAPQWGSPLQAQESGAETTVSFQPDSTSVVS